MNRYFGVHVLDGEWHALLPRYLVLAERLEDKRVLDIGCGTGIGSSMLLELGASHVDGVDYRPGVLDLAKIKHAKESLTFHMMLWEDLDFPDDSFDLVVCLDPTTPVTDPNLLEEVSRVLTDDGEYVCAIERRTIEGFESLLPKYGYSAPAENVELGQRDEQAPQIGELSNYFDKLVRVLQRPEYNYVFEDEQIETEGESIAAPVDYTLCTEDSHIAGVELIYCGSDEMEEPPNKVIRLPYYRLAERLGTVIRDLNVRQGPGGNQQRFDGPLEPGLDEETSPEEGTNAGWDDDSPTNVTERPEEDDGDDSGAETFGGELDRITGAYRQLQKNFEQLQEQTQAAMVAQERSISQLVEMLRQWKEGEGAEGGFGAKGPGGIDQMETGIYDSPSVPEDELAAKADGGMTEEERAKLVEQMNDRESYIEELEQKVAELTGEDSEADEDDDSSLAEESSDLSEASESDAEDDDDSSDDE